MFPTFTQYTTKYPRRTVLIGFIIFALVAYLWVQVVVMPKMKHTGEQIQQEEVYHEPTFEERLKVLDSLKSPVEDTRTKEEKLQTLESLSSGAEDTVSAEERMRVLESLRNN